MKTIRRFVFVVVAAACAGCATHGPAPSSTTARTLPALPQPQIYSAAKLAALRKTPGGNYPGYQHIVVDGKSRYCRRNFATDSNTDSRVICLTEIQLWSEQLRAQELASVQEQDLRFGIQQIQNQEAWRQQAQNIAASNPVTVMPMTHP